MGFLLGQFTGWKWEISNLVDGLSFQLVIAKLKYLRTCKLSAQMPHFQHVWDEAKFLKIGKYLWRYRIFAGTVYRLKVGNFKSCRWAKFSPCHCKTKIPAHLKFSAQMPTFNTYEMKQSFWKSVKYLWRYRGFLLGQFTGWKWKISNLVDGLSFHLAIAKVKYLRTCKFSAQMPTFNNVWDEMNSLLKNRWNTFGDIRFLLVLFTGWNWEISNLVDGLSFHLVIAKVKYLLTWNFLAQKPTVIHVWDECKVFGNRLNTFGDMGFLLGTVYSVESGKFQILSMG